VKPVPISFYHRANLRRKEQLYDAILHPDKARAGAPAASDPEALIRVGVTSTSSCQSGDRVRQASHLGKDDFREVGST